MVREVLVKRSVEQDDADGEKDMADKALPQDLYGAVMYRTVKCLRDEDWFLLAQSWLKMVVNIGLQVFIILTVHFNINVDSKRAFQPEVGLRAWIDRLTEVQPYHRLDNASMTGTLLLDRSVALDADLIDFCDGLPMGWLLHVAWFLWTVVSMQEIISVYELAKNLWFAAHVDYGNQALQAGSFVISGLSTKLKGLFIVAMIIPKFVISLSLWWCGIEFLGYGTNTASVVLRIMALKFVLTLDELIFGAFASNEFKAELKKAKIKDWKHHVPIWVAELSRVIVAACFCIVCEIYFADIMEIRDSCHSCVHSCSRLCSNAWDYCSTDPCATSWMPIFFDC